MTNDAPGRTEAAEAHRFGEFVLDARGRRLLRRGEEIHLQPKTFEGLLYLLERRGELVSKRELMDALWPDRVVTENSLTRCIRDIRRALNDDAASPRFIRTVPRAGYRFLADDENVPSAEPESDVRTLTRPRRYQAGLFAGLALGLGVVATLSWFSTGKRVEQQLLLTFAGAHAWPSFAPDGTRIAFVADADGVAHVFTAGIDDGEPRQLTVGDVPAARPRWSPRDDRILFMRGGDMWTVPVPAGDARPLGVEGDNPNWSWDGARIVFERGHEIWTMDADGGRQQRIEGVPTTDLRLADRTPAFSPDGRRIAFFHAGSGVFGDLWIIGTDGGGARRLTSAPHQGGYPVWTPDGQHIIYQASSGGGTDLWQVAVSDGAAEPVVHGPGLKQHPDVSRDGSRIAYSHATQQFSVVELDPNTGAERVLIRSHGDLGAPTYSPDGSEVVFFGHAGGRMDFDVFIMSAEPGSTRRRPATGAHNSHFMPEWPQASRWVYFYSMFPEAGYWRAPSSGGTAERIAAGWTWNEQNGAHPSPDGERIAYSRLDRGLPATTLVRDRADGTERPLGFVVKWPRWSPDGSRIAGTQYGSPSYPIGDIVVCDPATDACRTLTRGYIPRWHPDGTRLYFLRMMTGGRELWSIGADGSGEQKVAELAPLFPIGEFFDVAPDGRIVWVRYERSHSQLWMLQR